MDVVTLAAELLAIPSQTKAEGQAVEFVSRWLIAKGWSVTVQEVSPGRGNVWATRGKGAITLSTHLDTVPPYIPPRLEGERLYGRGACDAKGIAAAMMVAAENLAARGERRVDLLFVVGEEKGSDGARLANQLPATSRFLLNGEPTESRLATGTKGSLRVIVRTKGRAAHSAYSHLGKSAILPMIAMLPELERLTLPSDPQLGNTTINIGLIRGGTEANIVPDLCETELMVRVIGDPAPVRLTLEKWAEGKAELEWGSYTPMQRLKTIPGFETGPMAYTTDVPFLSRWGTPLLFGPGSIRVAHTPDEFVDVGELKASVDSYERLALSLLAS
jgi:acetylornithine deacetylase